MEVRVLRLAHRKERDKRLTTHCALISRALGASRINYTGEKDAAFELSIRKVRAKWGGAFQVRYSKGWERVVASAKRAGFKIVHLTMYGEPFESRQFNKNAKLLVVIGGSKVPRGVYDEADYNLSVTNQPHSEAGALAVFLHSLSLRPRHAKWKSRIKPNARGKNIRTRIKYK